MRFSRAFIVPLAILLAAGGCAPIGKKANRSSPPTPVLPTLVVVTNNNWAQMVVYAVRSGSRIRLGSVGSMRTEVLRVPATVVSTSGNLQLMLDPIGSRGVHVTHSFQVAPGQEVHLTIENYLPTSTVTVWNQ